jgi:hypothetical protein
MSVAGSLIGSFFSEYSLAASPYEIRERSQVPLQYGPAPRGPFAFSRPWPPQTAAAAKNWPPHKPSQYHLTAAVPRGFACGARRLPREDGRSPGRESE